MSVVAFERKQNTGEWSEKELSTIVAALSAATCAGDRTRMGNRHDGKGRRPVLSAEPASGSGLRVVRVPDRRDVTSWKTERAGCLFEHRNLELVALHAKAAVPSTSWLMVRAITLWCAVRSALHEKAEPWLVEGEELFVQFVPQLAAFA